MSYNNEPLFFSHGTLSFVSKRLISKVVMTRWSGFIFLRLMTYLHILTFLTIASRMTRSAIITQLVAPINWSET